MAKPKFESLQRFSRRLDPSPLQGLTERLIDVVKAWVLDGVIAPGERMPPERDLATLLKVSRSSIRPALKSLEVMGVLEARQGSGTYLTESAESILSQPADLLMPLRGVSFAELFEARRAMEVEAAASAAARAHPHDIADLQALIERMRSHLSHPAAYFASDVAFHQKIAQVSGNAVFVWFNEMVVKVLSDAWRQRARHGDHSRSTFLEHQAIFTAIQRHDPHAARQAMLSHLDLSKFYSPAPTDLELRVLGRSTRAA
jgi:GntR family transcriptional regulator, transcriptional repressor for pyruvate dehydrogenase complex